MSCLNFEQVARPIHTSKFAVDSRDSNLAEFEFAMQLSHMAIDDVRLCTMPDEARWCLDHSTGRDTDPYWLQAVSRLAMASIVYEVAEAAQDVSEVVRSHREAQVDFPPKRYEGAHRAHERAMARRTPYGGLEALKAALCWCCRVRCGRAETPPYLDRLTEAS